MLEFETVEVIADIIAHGMDIPEGQIATYNPGIPPPQQQELFIGIDITAKEVLANNIRYESRENNTDLWQLQTLQVRELVSVTIVSLDAEAHERNHEIVLALGSTYAQQMQEKYSLQIARTPSSFTNTSGIVDSTNLNRYTIIVAIQRAYYKESTTESFDQFQPVSLITQPATSNSTP